jgi:outer membrane biosynthesis protein TonB
VGSIAYVELEENNGGIVLNISEGGLSLTAVGVLAVEHLPRIRVQLPRSRDWVELPAEIAWVSESKKEAGIRFHELTPGAATRIKNWISLEASPAEIQRERGRYAKRETPLPVNPSDRVAEPPILAPEIFQTAAPEEPRVPSISPTVTAPEIATMESAPQAALQGPRASSDKAGSIDNSSRAVERRSQARCRVKSLVYIELGKSNCGIVANISENGLHLEAAVALIGDRVPLMRFQLPHSRKWIETSGKVVWTSESRRKAGIQFVDLPADEQAQMKEWVSLEASPVQIPAPRETAREKYERLGQAPIAHEPRSQVLGSGASDQASQTPAQPHMPSPIPASSSLSLKVPAPVSAQSIRPPKPVEEARKKPRAEGITGRMNSGLRFRDWRTVAASIALISVLSFVVGWFAARQRAGNKTTQIAGLTAEATSESTKRVEPPPTNTDAHPSIAGAEGAPPQGHLEPPTLASRKESVPVIAAGAGGRGALRPPANSVSNAPSRAAENMRSAVRPLEPPAARPAANVPKPSAKDTPPPAPGGLATQSIRSVVASPSPIPDRPEGAAVVPTKEKESATPLPKPPEIPVIPAGSVSVSFPAFPSIRVPLELKSQSSRLGTSLQIGQLMSRVEPLYPEVLRRQGIEGTIKLHAIIGRDGAVQSVGFVSGPPLLAPLAMGAIREWHFKQTLLGGQPIETEADITVIFRLANPAIRSN